MRASEFITESFVQSLTPDQKSAIPAAYAIPELPNQDPYLQYRFGVALAGAKGAEQRKRDNVPSTARTSEWGENAIVVSYGVDSGPFIDDALKSMGLSSKKEISSTNSSETNDVLRTSPVKAFKGYPRK